MPLVEVTRQEQDFDRASDYLLDQARMSVERFSNLAPYRSQACEDAAGAYDDFASDYSTGDIEAIRLSAQVVNDHNTDLQPDNTLLQVCRDRYARVTRKVNQLVELLEDFRHAGGLNDVYD